MINRFNSEETYLANCQSIIGADGVYAEDLLKLEEWLASLTDDERRTVVTGEYEDMMEVCAFCPTNAEGHLLTGLFDDWNLI